MSENNSQMLARAVELASKLHVEQIDKSGECYVLHPIRIMDVCAPVHEVMMVAVLHDVIEDCNIGLSELREMGFSETVVSGIDSITRRVLDAESGQFVCRTAVEGEEKEIYADYIERAARNPISCIVKMKDIEDNLSPVRMNKLDKDEVDLMVKRYRRAQGELYRYFVDACFHFYNGLI